MRVSEGSSYLTETDAALENAREASKAKGNSASQRKNAFAETRDSVTISASAKSKYAVAVEGEDGAAVAEANNNTVYKNETHALKAALQQLSEESGVPLRGWGLGHYRKALRESGEGDLSAVRDIFNARYGIQSAPVEEDPAIVPTEDGDPSEGLGDDTGEPGGGLAGIVDADDEADKECGIVTPAESPEGLKALVETLPGKTAELVAELLE